MKYKIIFKFFLVMILLFASVSALNITQNSINNAMIVKIYEPAVYNLTINNNGTGDIFTIYNLLGFRMTPLESFSLGNRETKSIILSVYPHQSFSNPGNYQIEYFIKDEDANNIQKNTLLFKVVPLEESFFLNAEPFTPFSKEVAINLQNLESISYENVSIHLSSDFFDVQREFSFEPMEKKTFNVPIDIVKSNSFFAGNYPLIATAKIRGVSFNLHETLKFLENESIVTMKDGKGLFIRKTAITTLNDGNVNSKAMLFLRKNIISRLFSTFYPEPTKVDRHSFFVDYIWEKDLAPGEAIVVLVTTNLFFPFILVLFVVLIVVAVKVFSQKPLTIKKGISFVRVKGGEFALRVTLRIQAHKFVENVRIADHLPSLVKLHNLFDREKPKRYYESSRTLEWDFGSLDKGETRVLQYYLYSKLGILGKFALPHASAFFEIEGVSHEIQSNRAFFVTDQTKEHD